MSIEALCRIRAKAVEPRNAAEYYGMITARARAREALAPDRLLNGCPQILRNDFGEAVRCVIVSDRATGFGESSAQRGWGDRSRGNGARTRLSLQSILKGPLIHGFVLPASPEA